MAEPGYTYVVIVRPSMEGAYAEVLDVTALANTSLAEKQAVNQALKRMGDTPLHDIQEEERLANYINMLWLRVRFNNAEGPFLVKTEEPITDGETWDRMVRNQDFMERLRKDGRL